MLDQPDHGSPSAAVAPVSATEIAADQPAAIVPPTHGSPPLVWVLKCHRPGDHAQSLGLAQALGWPFIVKEMEFHWYEIFFALAARITLSGLYRRRSSPLTPPWPDLIIMAGRRNETPAKWIRRESGGKSRIVLIGRYWTPPRELDLVVTTRQFRLPAHPNVLHNDFPLHLTTGNRLAEAAALWRPRLEGLPGPYVTLLVGGSTGPYVFSRETARRLGREASALARSLGASLLVSTSARTGRGAMKALADAIDVPCHFYRWQPNDDDNPYLGFLGLADAVIVTADSMSMLAEACCTERPVYMFEFGGGPAAMHGPRSADPRIKQWWRWSQLRDQGVLGLHYAFAIGLPAWRLNRSRDIRLVQDIYIASGRARWLGDPDSTPARPAPLDDAGNAARRVHQLLAPETQPRIWLLQSDKAGDNAQLRVVADALPWPCEVKRVTVRDAFVFDKPSITPSLHHIDADRSDPLGPPWPDLVITCGRRMSMVALWIKAQSAGRTKAALIGLPKGQIDRFDLAVVSEQYRPLDRPNLQRIRFPLQRPDTAVIAAEAEAWRETLATLPRPLTAVMIGGTTKAVRFDAEVATKLAADLSALAAKDGGTLIVTTSRRTPPEVVEVLERALPPGTVLHRWTAGGGRNPYHALLGLADRFVVTGDSLSMLMEIAHLGRPLAIYPLPAPRSGGTFLDRVLRWVPVLERIASRLGLGHHRDMAAIHRLLVKEGNAIWFGSPFPANGRRPIDDLPVVVERIIALLRQPA